jgi:hypothetical protein
MFWRSERLTSPFKLDEFSETQQYWVLPVLELQVGGGVYPPRRSGATEAVTLLARAMAVTKETRDLWNSIIKKVNVVLKVLCV